MSEVYPRLVSKTPSGHETLGQGPPPGGEDPRDVFRLQVMEDLEEERALLYRFISVGEAIILVVLLRQIILAYFGA